MGADRCAAAARDGSLRSRARGMPLRGGASAITLRFWAMGREGENVQQLVREFEQQHPGVDGRRAADPVDRRAREAAHRLRRQRHSRYRAARQHVGAGVPARRRARPLDHSRRRIRRTSLKSDFFAGIWDTNVVDDMPTGFRGTSTRACSSIEKISSPPRAIDRCRRRGPNGATRWRRSSEEAGNRQ